MEGLSEHEKALAFAASWHPSFDGWAIVSKEFRFVYVNPQFCRIVGVSPAELIGEKFQDITPNPIKKLDEKNAQLVIDGVIPSYLLPKVYEFSSGKMVNVVLLVNGVYDKDGEFQFFLSRIMLDDEKLQLPLHASLQKKSEKSLLEFIKENGKVFVGIGGVVGGILIALLKYLEGQE